MDLDDEPVHERAVGTAEILDGVLFVRAWPLPDHAVLPTDQRVVVQAHVGGAAPTDDSIAGVEQVLGDLLAVPQQGELSQASAPSDPQLSVCHHWRSRPIPSSIPTWGS